MLPGERNLLSQQVELDALKKYLRPLPPAGRLGAIMALLHPKEDRPCFECGQMRKVEIAPIITKEQAIALMEELDKP